MRHPLVDLFSKSYLTPVLDQVLPEGIVHRSIWSDRRPRRVQAFRKAHGSVLTQGHLVTLKAHLASAVVNAKLQLLLKRIQPVWVKHTCGSWGSGKQLHCDCLQKLGAVAYLVEPSTWEIEAGGSLVPRSPRLVWATQQTLPQERKKTMLPVTSSQLAV